MITAGQKSGQTLYSAILCSLMQSRLSNMTSLCVIIFLLALSSSFAQSKTRPTGKDSISQERRQGLIQEAVKTLLGVKDVPSRDGKGPVRRHPTPPKYMLDLYDSYRSGQVPTKGNTVRSILPMKGKIEGVDMLVFNITGVHPSEQILQGQLHIFKRRKVKGSRRKDKAPLNFRLKVLDLTRKSVPSLAEMVIPRKAHGWQAYDVTEAVTICRTASHDGYNLLGVTMEMHRGNGRYRSVALKRVVKLNNQPFLIIFSEDRNNQSSPEDTRIAVEEWKTNDTTGKAARFLEGILSPSSRSKRSLVSNELPDTMASYYNNYAIVPQKKSPELMYPGPKSRKLDSSIIPSDLKPRKVSKKRKIENTRKRNNRKLPQSWHVPKKPHANVSNKEVPEDPARLCQKKKLVVDFANIGWSEWIISPKSFEAHYCSGRCAFPLTKRLRPSNHATIQSIVHAIGINEEVPAPCCVPDTMSSVTLLYFDEDRNVVLKNYPSMTVESCACR